MLGEIWLSCTIPADSVVGVNRWAKCPEAVQAMLAITSRSGGGTVYRMTHKMYGSRTVYDKW